VHGEEPYLQGWSPGLCCQKATGSWLAQSYSAAVPTSSLPCTPPPVLSWSPSASSWQWWQASWNALRCHHQKYFPPQLISIVISSRRCAGWLGLWIHMEKDRDHNIILNYQLGLWIHVGTRSKYDIELSNYYTNTRDHMVTWNIWLLIGPWLCIATSKTKPDGK